MRRIIDFPDPGNYQVISFDVFDTALLRLVHEPRDVFMLMEDELVEKHGNVFLGFSDWRFKAEIDTVSRVWKEDRGAEATLSDIYTTLFHARPHTERFAEELVEAELRTERSVIVPSRQVLDYYNRARQLGKKTIFVSDTYLPAQHIAAILKGAGYRDYDDLFVSCEVGTNKASGRLFDTVLAELGVDPEAVLHVGDNETADVAQPSARGMGAQRTCNPAALLDDSRYGRGVRGENDVRDTAASSIFRGLQKNYLVNGSRALGTQRNSGHAIGYQILGPVCYGFMRWTIEHAREKKIDRLHFVAREGWFLKKVFDEIESIAKTGIESHYFYASRRALFFPMTSRPVGECLTSFLLSKKPAPLAKYLYAINLEIDDDRVRALGFARRDEVIDPSNNPRDKARLEALFDAETDQVEKLARKEKELYLAYLREVGVLSTERIALVDSGWFGNGQRKLQQLLRPSHPDATFHGFYLALHPHGKPCFNECSHGHGYLYQFDDFGDHQSFLELARVIEVFLSAPSESLKRFEKRDGRLQPVFMRRGDSKELHPVVADIHEGALEFVRDFASTPMPGLPELPGRQMANLLRRLLMRPTREEALCIGSLPYEANVLAVTKEHKFAFPELGLTGFLRDPRRLGQEFEAAAWRSAYYVNQESLALRFVLKTTQTYFWPSDGYANRARNLARRTVRKLKRLTRDGGS